MDPDPTRARLVGPDQASKAALWAPAAREGHAIASRDVDLAEMAEAVEAALRWHHAVIVAAAEDGQAACVGVW